MIVFARQKHQILTFGIHYNPLYQIGLEITITIMPENMLNIRQKSRAIPTGG